MQAVALEEGAGEGGCDGLGDLDFACYCGGSHYQNDVLCWPPCIVSGRGGIWLVREAVEHRLGRLWAGWVVRHFTIVEVVVLGMDC